VSGRRWHHWRPRWRRRKHRQPSAWQPSGVEHLNGSIEHYKELASRATGSDKAQLLEKLLVLQTPRAALAQAQMDAHPRGYRDREKRLYELIDFNDTFVSAVLAQPKAELPTFVPRMQLAMARFCKSQKAVSFTGEQFEAIVKGLSREIAVFLGAKELGFEVSMTSRTVDAFGIDMIIRHPSTGARLNIDCKTPSAFRHRMEDLLHQGRISENDLLKGDERGFLTVVHHHNKEIIPVTLLCILPDLLGEISNFTFDEPKKLKHLLNTVFASEASK
jgi:hypothetical protein